MFYTKIDSSNLVSTLEKKERESEKRHKKNLTDPKAAAPTQNRVECSLSQILHAFAQHAIC